MFCRQYWSLQAAHAPVFDLTRSSIVRKMHDGKPTLGGRGLGGWGATFVSWRAHEGIYNAAEDKDLWTAPESGSLWSPRLVLGEEPGDPVETLDRMRTRGFWPVSEGKHIDQYLNGIKPIRWWLSFEQAGVKYDKLPPSDPLLVFRETARNTDERTCIAAVLPERSAASHTLSGIQVKNVRPEAAGTVLNSFCFDFALRLRTAGTHVSFTYIKAVPVPPALWPTIFRSFRPWKVGVLVSPISRRMRTSGLTSGGPTAPSLRRTASTPMTSSTSSPPFPSSPASDPSFSPTSRSASMIGRPKLTLEQRSSSSIHPRKKGLSDCPWPPMGQGNQQAVMTKNPESGLGNRVPQA